jgi:hypothetical protein
MNFYEYKFKIILSLIQQNSDKQTNKEINKRKTNHEEDYTSVLALECLSVRTCYTLFLFAVERHL